MSLFERRLKATGEILLALLFIAVSLAITCLLLYLVGRVLFIAVVAFGVISFVYFAGMFIYWQFIEPFKNKGA